MEELIILPQKESEGLNWNGEVHWNLNQPSKQKFNSYEDKAVGKIKEWKGNYEQINNETIYTISVCKV